MGTGPDVLERPRGQHGEFPGIGFKLSALRPLEKGLVVSGLTAFPECVMNASYQDPLDESGLALEQSVLQRISEQTLGTYLDGLTALYSRSTTNSTASDAAVEHLLREFQALGVTTCLQEDVISAVYTIKNVIGYIPGSGGGSFTFGAHYDNRPFSGRAQGALDNGSGVAGVLTALKALLSAGASFERSLYFVAFGGEETGLYGSSIFARALVGEDGATLPDACRFDSSGDHRGLVFDMIGWRNPSFDQDTLLLETYEWAGFLRDHVATANQVNFGGALKLLCSNNPFGSDHMPFLDRNIPIVLSIGNDGDCYKYPCYHQACDTRDQHRKIERRGASAGCLQQRRHEPEHHHRRLDHQQRRHEPEHHHRCLDHKCQQRQRQRRCARDLVCLSAHWRHRGPPCPHCPLHYIAKPSRRHFAVPERVARAIFIFSADASCGGCESVTCLA